LHGGRGQNPDRLVFPAFDVQLPGYQHHGGEDDHPIALANCATSLMLLHQISPMDAGICQEQR
jgi:hypothetical protein